MVEKKRQDGKKTDYKIWKWLRQVVQMLGPSGMSSDDSEGPEGHGARTILRIHLLPWRRDVRAEMDIIERHRDSSGAFSKQSWLETVGEITTPSSRGHRCGRRL